MGGREVQGLRSDTTSTSTGRRSRGTTSDLKSDEVDEDLASGNNGFGYALGAEVGQAHSRSTAGLDGDAAGAGLIYSSVDFDSFHRPVRGVRARTMTGRACRCGSGCR